MISEVSCGHAFVCSLSVLVGFLIKSNFSSDL